MGGGGLKKPENKGETLRSFWSLRYSVKFQNLSCFFPKFTERCIKIERRDFFAFSNYPPIDFTLCCVEIFTFELFKVVLDCKVNHRLVWELFSVTRLME